MESEVRSWDLVEHLFDVSITPERLDELIRAWDTQIQRAAPEDSAGSAFACQIADVLKILEQLQAAELRRVNDLLSGMLGAAMVFTKYGEVVAANEAANAVFGLQEGGSIQAMPLDEAGLDEFARRVSRIAGDGGAGEEIVQLRPTGLDRLVLVHLKAMRGGDSRRHVLAVTSELAWPAAMSEFLVRVFGLTPAEIEVMRLLAAGGTVQGMARATRRVPGTLRSHLHALLQKTSTQSQAEVVRLAILLMQSIPADAEPVPPPAAPEPHQRFMRMGDGRRVEILSFGDPAGRPVIWMQSPYGYFRLPSPAEEDLARRRLRVLVPFRAGYCGSDPSPEPNKLELAVADMLAVMGQLRIESAPVVAVSDDIRIALMLAQADPARVRHIFGLAAAFPILNDAQYRRLMPIARFVRACARYQPLVLPFMIKGLRATVGRVGVERYLRGLLANVPADARAFADPEIAAARARGVEYLFFHDNRSEAAFSAEQVLFHQDWPEGLGHVACPVTLIHGEEDANAPFENALDYCSMYPEWRLVRYPDHGELVAQVRWREVLDMIEATLAPPLPPLSGHARQLDG